MQQNAIPAVYAVKLTALFSEECLFSRAVAASSEERREKAARCKKKEDAARSLAAGLLLRYAFKRAGQSPPATILYGENGKPSDARGALCFNLAHSGEWAVCAVARGAVGCDVEQICSAPFAVAERFFSAREQQWLDAAANEADKTVRFFRLWTMKEAFQKADGRGLALPLSSFSVVPSLPYAVEGSRAIFKEYTDLPGYACALCLLEEETPPPLQTVPLDALF